MTFEWIDCSFFLKKNVGGSEVTINLTPYHRLQLIRENQEIDELTFKLSIEFQRNLMYDGSIGWNWHKSWTVPDINVELQANPASDPKARINSFKNLHAEIYIVKPIISKEYSLCVEDLGLEGNTCFELVGNHCTFTGLKFAATSYNNEGSKFHFLLTVYDKCQGEPSKILLSRISTPIFVDSRKSAREAELIKLKRLSAYIEPFEVASFYKRYVKKESKKSRGYAEEEIENNLSGLYNYFGAANIRNKVKHPLFLAVKFSECFHIYYRKELLVEGANVLQLLQEALMAIYGTINAYRPPTKLSNKKVILVVRTENLMGRVSQHKRIPEFLEPIALEDVGCLVDDTSIPQGFVQLATNPDLVQLYTRTLKSLQAHHTEVYNNFELELKQQVIPNFKKPEKIETGTSPQQTNEQPEPIESKFKNGTTVDCPDPKNISSFDDEIWDHQSESVSTYSISNNFPDVPLKCEMVVDPVRHRPLKLLKLIQSRQHGRDYVYCQKRLLSDAKQLTILNQLMRMDIEQKKATLKRKHAEREESIKAAFHFASNIELPLLNGYN